MNICTMVFLLIPQNNNIEKMHNEQRINVSSPTETPDFDIRIITSRYDFIFSKSQAAHRGLMTYKRSSASPFFP